MAVPKLGDAVVAETQEKPNVLPYDVNNGVHTKIMQTESGAYEIESQVASTYAEAFELGLDYYHRGGELRRIIDGRMTVTGSHAPGWLYRGWKWADDPPEYNWRLGG